MLVLTAADVEAVLEGDATGAPSAPEGSAAPASVTVNDDETDPGDFGAVPVLIG